MKNAEISNPQLPEVCLRDLSRMTEVRKKIKAGNQGFEPALSNLCHTADEMLQTEPYSVMDKEVLPPSGDKHDYMSLGTYWWPNPETENGLPYVRRDGEVNPEGYKLDVPRLKKLCSEVVVLANAFFFTENSKYSQKCRELLQTWFINPETRMNPNLNFGQGIPGICEGRGIGIIDTAGFTNLLDAVGILNSSGEIPEHILTGLKDWMNQYLDWLVESPIGINEAGQQNNHGTWYDVQVVRLAIFTGRKDLASEICENAKKKRISVQIEPDGSQPKELSRTRSRDYTGMNTRGLLNLAAIAAIVDVDLLNYSTRQGQGIKSAIDWLIPYASGEKDWIWQQITDLDNSSYIEIFRRAAIYYHDEKYENVLNVFDKKDVIKHNIQLIYPIGK